MADIVADGTTKVYWVTTIAAPSGPTVAELNAGVDLTTFITADGWQVNTSTASVDTSDLSSTDDTFLPGRRSDDISVTLKSQGDAAAPWTTFASRPAGYLVERVGVAYSTVWTAAQKVRVFPVTAGDRGRIPAAANEVIKFTVPFFKSDNVQDQATVAA